MANRGGQLGNNNAAKNKYFTDALKRRLIQSPERLERIVDVLISEAEKGEPWAVREIMDRVDGKPTQVNQINTEHIPVECIEVQFIKSRGELETRQPFLQT